MLLLSSERDSKIHQVQQNFSTIPKLFFQSHFDSSISNKLDIINKKLIKFKLHNRL